MAEPTYEHLIAAYSQLRKAASQLKTYEVAQAMGVVRCILQHKAVIDGYRTGDQAGDGRREVVSRACAEMESIARSIGLKRDVSGFQRQFVTAAGDLVVKIDEALF